MNSSDEIIRIFARQRLSENVSASVAAVCEVRIYGFPKLAATDMLIQFVICILLNFCFSFELSV